MTSFLGSYKTEISNSLKQVKRLGLIEARRASKGKKKQQENLGPSLF